MRKRKEIIPISPGDNAYFHELYQENKNLMIYIAGKCVQSQSEREDIVQDAVVRLLNNISVLKQLNEKKLRQYVILTVKSAFHDSKKCKHEKRLFALDNAVLENIGKDGYFTTEEMSDISYQLEIERLKKKLSPRDWLVLEGKYIFGYSQEELGKLIGVSPNSVRMALCRAREKAYKILNSNRGDI